ncbi:MAG: SpoIIE family protein phosphatase [Ignavibacteriales bacterium]|nr:SpoIIE family protein phosphatase [Ignavibacteriales bacterium]
MSHKILVVDDEPDLELLIKQKFRKEIKDESFRFVFAHNGVQALERLEEHDDVSVVLSDINMPEMDGLTLLQKLNELNNPLLKSVIVSAYGDMENIRTAMNRGAFDFLTKPIDFNKSALKSRDELVAVQRDLTTAARIQQSLLPNVFPPFPQRSEFEIHAEMITAKNVGGDFYDFYFLDEDRLAFAIGDVSGKGIPAAIYMAVCRTLLKATAHQVAHSGEVLRRVNALLIPESEAATFVTIFYGILNTRTGEVQYSNGGHNSPMIVRSTGEVELLPMTDGFLVGKIEHQDYDAKKIQLQIGDTLFLYTDGVTEAMDSDMNMFEEERLTSYLKKSNGSSTRELARGSLAELKAFAGNAPQSDDITVLILRYLGRNLS